MKILKVDLTHLKEYADHLKALPEHDRISRFGFNITDYAIDQLALKMAYNPNIHILWMAIDSDCQIMGWGHMARDHANCWELALSVESNHQRKGVGDALIREMLSWAKFNNVGEVFMHCIESNKVIQHLAAKHKLQTRERGGGERTAALQIPEPSFFEKNAKWFKEYSELVDEMSELRLRMLNHTLGITPHHTGEVR